jgi:hypothetical protein
MLLEREAIVQLHLQFDVWRDFPVGVAVEVQQLE